MNYKEFKSLVGEKLLDMWLWIAPDGLLHIAVSALIMFALGWLRPLWGAVIITLCFGIIKEAYDISKGGKSVLKHTMHDVACDIIGICIGLLLVFINSLP